MKSKGFQKHQHIGWSFLLVFILLLTTPSQTLADEEYRFERMWPALQQPWYFASPVSIAVAPDGSVYVADSFNNRTQKFTSDGQFVMKWGSFATGDGEFVFPLGIAIDSNGGAIPRRLAWSIEPKTRKFFWE